MVFRQEQFFPNFLFQFYHPDSSTIAAYEILVFIFLSSFQPELNLMIHTSIIFLFAYYLYQADTYLEISFESKKNVFGSGMLKMISLIYFPIIL